MTPAAGRGRLAAALLVNISACCAIATALWLLPASVHIVQWTGSVPTRLALLLPAWQLAVAVAVGAVAGGAAGVLAPASSRILAPFNFLWLWVVPYVPWLPDRLPLLLILAGPLRWLIPALLAACFTSGTSTWHRLVDRMGRISRTAVFVVSFLVYAAAGVSAIRANGLVGDEPHYLIITESLLRDGDLRIENNHQQRDYRSFFPGELRPDYMQRGTDGAIYSIHAPGLAVLVLPAYRVAGHYGVAVFLALLAAWCTLAMFDVCAQLGGHPAAALAWIVVSFATPFVPYAWSIFPELPGALVVAWAVKWLLEDRERSETRWLVRGVALATLPWLHTKFTVFVALFGVAFAVRLWPRIKREVAFLSPIAVSGLAWLYSFYAIYGRFDPEAPYGAYTRIYVLMRNIPHGLLGLFFDQKFGLLFYSPIYLAALAGAWLMWRRREHRFVIAVLALVVAFFVGSTARLYMFWGGSSAPARFLVPLVPCMAPFIAVAIAHARTAWARSLVGVWAIVGLAPAIAAMLWPRRLLFFSDPHGRARFLELLQGPSPLASVMPTFTDPDWATHVVPLVGWIAVVAIAAALMGAASRSRTASAWHTTVVALLVSLVGAAILTARPSASTREETARRGDIDVLTRFDGDRFRTLDYSNLSRTSPERLLLLTTIEASPANPAGENGYVGGPYTLPPGRYDAEVWFASSRPRDGDVTVRGLPQAVFGRTNGTLANPATVPFTLPVTVRRLMIGVTDEATAAAVSRIAIVPRDVVPPRDRESVPIRVVEALPGTSGAYLAYTDGEAYPENGVFWSRGTARTTVLVAPNGARRMTVHLSTGPRSGEVTVAVADAEQRVIMAADTPNQLSFDLPAGARLVPLSVQSSVMFRPGEVDSGSGDMRGLGCQVHITLE